MSRAILVKVQHENIEMCNLTKALGEISGQSRRKFPSKPNGFRELVRNEFNR
jgi:hypothetical protein